MAEALALVDDLFFQAKMLETAKQVSVQLRTFCASRALLSEAAKTAPNVVIVDLNAKDHPVETISRLREQAPGVAVVAYLSHVQTDLAQRARDAGCPRVIPRSQFTRELATILLQARSQCK
jgi:DNA-binding NarL/FixJ family response regulator